MHLEKDPWDSEGLFVATFSPEESKLIWAVYMARVVQLESEDRHTEITASDTGIIQWPDAILKLSFYDFESTLGSVLVEYCQRAKEEHKDLAAQTDPRADNNGLIAARLILGDETQDLIDSIRQRIQDIVARDFAISIECYDFEQELQNM